jgi:hypothetical protein
MRRVGLVALLILAAFGSESRGIEMFTYFGDGSRIGLPSLEVPIEAYPGIPLRSDRLRARRRAMRPGSPSPVPGTPLGGGITIRPMPTTAMPEPVAVEPVPTPKATPAATAAENTASQPTAN